jgi:hypothetical protein
MPGNEDGPNQRTESATEAEVIRAALLRLLDLLAEKMVERMRASITSDGSSQPVTKSDT